MHNLKILAAMAKHFASTDFTRYYMNGVLMPTPDEHCRKVAHPERFWG